MEEKNLSEYVERTIYGDVVTPGLHALFAEICVDLLEYHPTPESGQCRCSSHLYTICLDV